MYFNMLLRDLWSLLPRLSYFFGGEYNEEQGGRDKY